MENRKDNAEDHYDSVSVVKPDGKTHATYNWGEKHNSDFDGIIFNHDDEYEDMDESRDSTSKERSGVGNVIVEFNTPTESGLKSIQKLMSLNELQTWFKKIGEEDKLQDIYLQLASEDETSFELKPISVKIRHN